MKNSTVRVLLIALSLSFLPGTLAHAETYTVTPSMTSALTVSGDTVTVILAGVPQGVGVYVRLCKAATNSGARPELCFGQGNWVTSDTKQWAFGARDISTPVQLAVQAVFLAGSTSVDCRVDSCGIHIRRDHNGGASDTSLDKFIPVSFGTVSASQSPTPTPAVSKSTGKIVVNGKYLSCAVTGVKGKVVTFQVGKKKYTRSMSKDFYTFTITKPGQPTTVVISVGGKVVASKKIS